MSDANSAIVVAKILSTEGFSEHVADQVDRFARRQMGSREKIRHDKTEKAMATICANLDEVAKIVIGKFITLHKKMAFETGVRVGLTAMAVKESKDYPDGDVNFPRDIIWGIPTRKNQNYRVEILRYAENCSDMEWGKFHQEFADRSDAKIKAVQLAKKHASPTRVLQAGHVVQRYTKKGTRIGGD